ncbi:MAG: accessory gene regulator B family protein [Solirubrobacterales bacterium]
MDIAEKISKTCAKFVSKNLEITEDELEKIEYGAQVIFVNLVKLIILFLIASILRVANYTCIAIISFASIRIFASGIHADSNIKCTITNILLFLGNVYFSMNIVLNKYMNITILALSLLLVILYAPADTEDRPLLSKRLRKKLKIYSITITLFMGAMAIKCESDVFSNLIIFSVLEASLLITPISYYIFNKRYRNYENINL